MVCSPFQKITQFLSLHVLVAFGIQEKVVKYNVSTFLTQKCENTPDMAPLRLGKQILVFFQIEFLLQLSVHRVSTLPTA